MSQSCFCFKNVFANDVRVMFSFSGQLLRLHLKRRCSAYAQSPALKYTDKIVYNSVLQSKKTGQYWANVKNKIQNKNLVEIKHDVVPVCLQYLDGYAGQDETETVEPKLTNEISKPHNLPYSIVSKINKVLRDDENVEDDVNSKVNYDCMSLFNAFLILFIIIYIIFLGSFSR